MAFKKGDRGNPNGRPKGSLRKVRYDASEFLRTVKLFDHDGKVIVGFNPLQELAQLGKTARSEKVRQESCSDLCSFLMPKLKSIEHKGDKDAPLKVLLQF